MPVAAAAAVMHGDENLWRGGTVEARAVQVLMLMGERDVLVLVSRRLLQLQLFLQLPLQLQLLCLLLLAIHLTPPPAALLLR